MGLHFKTALDCIRRSPFQAMSAIFVLALTFFVTTALVVLVYASNQVVTYFETRPQVISYLKDDAKEEDIKALNEKLSKDERVTDVKFVNKEEALAIYKEITSDNPLLGELVSPTIFPASLEFSLSDLSYATAVIEEVRKEPVVDQVGFTASLGKESELGSVVDNLQSITNYIRIGGSVFAGVLLTTSFLVLLVIISMRLSARKGEIEILDLIGATPGFIRSPIVIEALIYTILGVLIGWVVTFIIVLYSLPSVVKYFELITVLPKDVGQLSVMFGMILAVELFVGMFLALLGSFLAVSRAKK